MGYAAKMRKYRESKVTLEGKTIVFRRPTDLDMASRPMNDETREHMNFWTQFVCGWDMIESDLIPGGNNEPVPFDLEDFREWLADRGKLWSPLVDAVRDSYIEANKKRRQI